MTALNSVTLQSPGTLGLNTQDEDDIQDARYCVQADNCIIAKNGLLETRKGAAKVNTAAATGTPDLDVVYSYIEDDGTENIVSTGGNKIWVGTTTLSDETGSLTITADNWQFQNYAGEVFGYQTGHAPIFWDGVAASFALLSSKVTSAGLVNSHCHLSAYGRSWVVDTTTPSQINYSDLLVPEDFTNGSAGTIDLNTVWPYSNDTITCMATHNNNLIIFCERSIVIYGNANDITNIALIEVIKDIGCIARDSVQNIGNDILFLAKDGVRSLSRTILQDNMPQKEITNNVRDDIINDIIGETATLIRSTYNEKEGFYLLNFPSIPVVWAIDTRLSEQGIFRPTRWTLQCYGLATGADNDLYIGLAGGWLAKYDGYNDTDTATGNIDQTYIVKYKSGWIKPVDSLSQLIWKRLTWYIASLGDISTVTKWAFDFIETEKNTTKSLPGIGASTYGSFKYGAGVKYGGTYQKQKLSVNMKGVGNIIRVGFQSVVNGGKFAFNKTDLFFKAGRVR